MQTSSASHFSVFGSIGTDATVFIGSCLAAILAAAVAPHFMSSQFFFLLLLSCLDAPHIVAGVYFMYTDSRARRRTSLTLKFLGIFFFALLVCFPLVFYRQEAFLLVAFTHLSVWHFIRQHQAWFKAASRPSSSRSKLFQNLNLSASYAATWALLLASLCGKDRFGWYGVNDLFLLPAGLKIYLFVFSTAVLLGYLFLHLSLYLKTKEIYFSQHIILASMLIVWFCSRHIPAPYLAPALIFFPHCLTYFYLLHRSSRRQGLSPIRWYIVLPFILLPVALINFLGLTYVPLQTHPLYPWFIGLALSLSVTHVLTDRLYWNSKDNPGWSEALRPQSKTSSRL